jgi:hypothetical protein
LIGELKHLSSDLIGKKTKIESFIGFLDQNLKIETGISFKKPKNGNLSMGENFLGGTTGGFLDLERKINFDDPNGKSEFLTNVQKLDNELSVMLGQLDSGFFLEEGFFLEDLDLDKFSGNFKINLAALQKDISKICNNKGVETGLSNFAAQQVGCFAEEIKDLRATLGVSGSLLEKILDSRTSFLPGKAQPLNFLGKD